MEKETKKSLNKLSGHEYFTSAFKKLILGKDLSNVEKSFILSCSIIFLKYYEKDKRFSTYLELSYYIILKYSLKFKDYKPLYDFSINIGFLPIANFLLKNNLISNQNFQDNLIYQSLIEYQDSNKTYIQTLEQFNQSKKFLEDKSKKKCYLAPTSYGKSSIIVDYIKKNDSLNKIAVIVPTKSLLNQTYKLIRRNIKDRKILIHNEMYNKELRFIAILTQERALKFIEKNEDFFFDLLVIDEAHNLFESDSRNILLSRLIKRNEKLNPNHEIIYLSPLVTNPNNLKLFEKDIISSNLIKFNIKEPTYIEYTTEGNIFVYNHFLDQFYKIGNISNKFEYIQKNSLNKNFLFENNPQKIEEFSKKLKENFQKINSPEIKKLKEIIIRETHEDFYMVELLDYGIIYLHGKLPNLIKEYLENKFNEIKDLKFIVSNTVILEGINLPIDNMFILNIHGINMKQLVNLIGRVNRLNTIFTSKNLDLDKLNPTIHFLNNRSYKDKGHNPKIEKLRNRIFDDTVDNPNLVNKNTKEKKEHKIIKDNEEFLNLRLDDPFSKLKRYFIENSLDLYYNDLNLAINSYLKNFSELNMANFTGNSKVLDLVYELFIKDLVDNIKDLEFVRLQHEPTRKYYTYFVHITSKLNLREAIKSTLKHFKEIATSRQPKLYFGPTYGQVPYNSSSYTSGRRVYVDLRSKDDNELINLSIVKLKMEEDFASYTLNRFVEALFDLKIITEDEKDNFIYGSTDKTEMELYRFGLSKKIIQQLRSTSQIQNVYFDEFGNLSYDEKFKRYLDNLDDFNRFELKKYFN